MGMQRALYQQSASSVGIAGMGIRTAIGCGLTQFQHNLLAGRQAFVKTNINEEMTLIHAPLSNPDFRQETADYKEGQKAFRLAHRAQPFAQHSVLAALEAWQQARDVVASISPDRRGIIMGAQNINHAYLYEQFLRYQHSPQYIKPSHGIQFLDTFTLGLLSEIFQIQGECFQTAAASATGNACIIQGMKQILSGAVDCCMVIGCMASLSPPDYLALRAIGALGGVGYEDHPNLACRPFDVKHNGFIPGDACACLILTKANVSQALLGYLLSWGMVMDANASADPNKEGEWLAMQRALKQANLAPQEIGYINAHGSASSLGDHMEAEALQRLFGEHLSKTWVNSTKGLTGHCLWSAGIVEAIATLVQLNVGQCHINPNLETPIHPELNLVRGTPSPLHGAVGLSNSFGFGGINTSLVIAKG